MILFETTVVLGLILGLIYALSGVGLVVIYRTAGYVSFAHGDIAALSLFVGLAGYKAGLPYPAVFVAVAALGAIIAGLIGSGVVIPMERHGHVSAALATVGAGLLIQGGENIALDPTPRAFPAVSEDIAFQIGSVGVSVADVVASVTSIVLFAALALFFRYSAVGIAMRAVSDNHSAANHVGIPAIRLKRLSWVISGALAAICGLFVAPFYSLTPNTMNAILIFGFAAVVMGGFESVAGALLGGMILGVSSNLVAAYLDPALVNFGVYLMVLAILIVRPYGMFGRRPLVRV